MGETRFEGSGPVARYWLSRCEGFAVVGDTRGVVVELIRDADPAVTTRLVVRTRGRRKKIISATTVGSVDPADRVVFVNRRPERMSTRPRRRVRTRGRAQAGASTVRMNASTATEGTRHAFRQARTATTLRVQAAWSLAALQARRVVTPLLLAMLGSFSHLTIEARSTLQMLRRRFSQPRTYRWRSAVAVLPRRPSRRSSTVAKKKVDRSVRRSA